MLICMVQWTSMNLVFGKDKFADIDFLSEVQWNNYCYNAVIACTKEMLGNEELPCCHENWFECDIEYHECFLYIIVSSRFCQICEKLYWGQKLAFALCWLLEALQFVVAINKPCGWTTQLPKLTNHFYRQSFQRVLVVAHVLSVFVIAFYTHAIWADEAS